MGFTHPTLCERIHETCCRRSGSGVGDEVELASCNGLLLCCWDSIWAIWKPLTGDHRDLPPRPETCLSIGSGILFWVGFGYDDYEVVRIEKDFLSQGKTVYRTFIYSLKQESWRQIGDCPCQVPWSGMGAFLNRKLYWLSCDKYEIVALHLGTETYSKIPLPSSVDLHGFGGVVSERQLIRKRH